MPSRPRIRSLLLLATLAPTPARAVTTTWTRGAGTGFFANNNNWSANKPSGAVDALFPTPIPGGVGQIIFTGAESAASLTFNDAYLLDAQSNPGTSLTLGAAGGPVTVNGTNVSAALDVLIAGANGLTKSGSGTLQLRRANTFSGGVTVGLGGGTLSVAADNQLGNAANGITLNGGTLNVRSSFTTSRALTFSIFGGTVDVGISQTFTLNSQIAANQNPITKRGVGTWVLNQASLRTATTTIQDGFVRLNNAAGLGSGPILIPGGTLEIPDATNVVNSVTLQDEGGLRATSGLGVYGGTCTVSPTASLVALVAASNATLRLGNVAPNCYTGGSPTTTTRIIGPGTVLLQTANDYAGNWTVDGSTTLAFFNGASLGPGTSAVVVNGTLELLSANLDRPATFTANPGATLAIHPASFVHQPVTLPSGTTTTFALRNTGLPNFPAFLGDSPNDLTGGTAGATINVTAVPTAPPLYLQHANDYAGNWTVGPFAKVRIADPAALGTGTSAVVLVNNASSNGGTLELGGTTLARDVLMTNGSTLRGASGDNALTGTVSFSLFGTVTLATEDPDDTLTLGDAPNDYTGGFPGFNVTAVTGPGAVILPFANNYDGDWRVDNGVLRIANTASLGTAATPVVVNAATLEIAGPALDRPVTLNNGATLRGTGPAAASLGTVNVTSATPTAITLASGTAATDVLTLGDAPNDLTGGSVSSGITVAGAGKVKLTQPSNYVGTWRLAGGTLEIDADDRLGHPIDSLVLDGGTLAFSQSVTTPRTIAANAGGIAVAPAPALVTLNGPLTTGPAGHLTKSGPGTLRIAGLQSHDPNAVINVDAGRVELFSPAAAAPLFTPSLTLNVNTGGTLTTNQTQHLKAFHIATGAHATFDAPTAGVLRTLALTTAGSGQLDLTNDKLIVVNGDLAAITTRVNTGFNAGTWNGPGIVTSVATSNTGLGAARAGDLGLTTFAGLFVSPSDVLVTYTLLGDATFDGAVDFNDLVRLAQNYNTTGMTWPQGDFTYDGNVDFNDLVKLAQNYNTALPATPVPGAPANFESDLRAALAHVPEPAGLLPWLLPATFLPTRRRRRCCAAGAPGAQRDL